MRARFVTLLVVLISLLLTGCPARWKNVFINGTQEEATVGFTAGSQFITIPPGGSGEVNDLPFTAEEFRERRVTVRVGSRTVLDERADQLLYALAPALQRYPHAYFLILPSGVYPLPEAVHKSWQQHLDDVVHQRYPKRSNHAMQPTAGQRTLKIPMISTSHPAATFALASGG